MKYVFPNTGVGSCIVEQRKKWKKSFGILLCKSKSKIVAEYALRSMKAPIGISEYTLSKAMPKELKSSLPTVEQIEIELNEKG